MMKKSKLALLCGALLGVHAIADTGDNQGLRLGMVHCCVESDTFMRGIADNIRKAAAADGNTVLFMNAEGDQEKQLAALGDLARQKPDVLLMSIVIDDTLDKPFQKKLMAALEQIDLPVVFYLLAPEEQLLLADKQAYRVGSTPAQSGILQGELVSKLWLDNPAWDKNGDGVMQYALLKGPPGNPDAEGRTKWVRATLATFPVGEMQSEEVAFDIANWDRKQAAHIVNGWIKDGTADNIEVLIANNDDMMLGAKDALAGSSSKPALFGIDALPEVLDLIGKGEVAGTILQDTGKQASNAYKLAVNLAAKRRIEAGLDFPVVRQELVVPYVPVTSANVHDVSN